MQEHTLRRYVLILSSLTVLLFVSVHSGAQEHSLSMTSALSPPLPMQRDGSLFNGRGPDENRFSMDTVHLDSSSLRFSMNPSPNTALQVSHGYLRSPEVLEPGSDVRRTTASVLWNYPVSSMTNLALSFIWGANKPETQGAQHSFLLEADYRIRDLSLFSRAELVRKSAEKLGAGALGKRLCSVGAVSLDAAKSIVNYKRVFLSLGFLGTVFGIDRELRPVYGRTPFSVEVFLRVSPGTMWRGHNAKGIGE